MSKSMFIGQKQFDFSPHNFYLMGILNITPDSFSDGGHLHSLDKVLFHAEQLINNGCHILDVGGESTRPNYTPISVEEEIARVAPVVTALKQRFDVPVSVDTYKASVAECVLAEGCDLINDIWGLKSEPAMAEVIARFDVPCVLMHNRTNNNYTALLSDIIADLEQSLMIAQTAGIDANKIILDPGIGFGKSYEQNLAVLKNLKQLSILDYPWLLGISRKSVIGYALDLPVDEREEGTVALNLWGYLQGMQIFRVHDAEKTRRALLMQQTILKAGVVNG